MTSPQTSVFQSPTPAAGQASAEVVLLGDGTQLVLRPMEPCDRDGLVDLFARLSAESRFRRFFSPKAALTTREIVYFLNVDHVDHEAIAAFEDPDGAILGVARYVIYSEQPRVADVALEVADDVQALGIGTALASRIVRRARENDVVLLTATTLRVNHAARRLAQARGFQARASRAEEIHWELSLERRMNGARKQQRGARVATTCI
jgi:GNAT superfamily N-acetyltransferase